MKVPPCFRTNPNMNPDVCFHQRQMLALGVPLYLSSRKCDYNPNTTYCSPPPANVSKEQTLSCAPELFFFKKNKFNLVLGTFRLSGLYLCRSLPAAFRGADEHPVEAGKTLFIQRNYRQNCVNIALRNVQSQTSCNTNLDYLSIGITRLFVCYIYSLHSCFGVS